jgi:DNA (cytosine-5)-methyltransferase 1
MTFGSLFAGIGGFDLGLERAGMTCKWQVEIDPFCRAVLAKHWPDVRRYEDVRTVGAELERVDVIAGGFPCQDISFAGGGEGIDGARSGLWREYRRLVGELRPRVVIVENVAALTIRGLGRVLGELAGLGFDAVWSDLHACALGLPHPRRRLFVVAYANGEHGRPRLRDSITRAFRPLQEIDGFAGARAGYVARLANPSELYGGADGVPYRLERNRGIGNAVCPDCAEWIGRRILEAERVSA